MCQAQEPHVIGRYFARKLGFHLLTLVVAVTVDWAIPRFMPGDPIQGLIARMQAQPGSQAALTGFHTEAFGLDVPLWQQYLNFWKGLFAAASFTGEGRTRSAGADG